MELYDENRVSYEVLKLAIRAKAEVRNFCFTIWGFSTGWAAGFFLVSVHYNPKHYQYYIADAAAFLAVLMMFCIWRIQKRLKHMVAAALCLLGMMDSETGSNRWIHYREQYAASYAILHPEATREQEANN